jgi:hypothetical protein
LGFLKPGREIIVESPDVVGRSRGLGRSALPEEGRTQAVTVTL